MGTRTDRAAGLAELVQGQLDQLLGDGHGAIATADIDQAAPAALRGGVVIINPPTLTWAGAVYGGVDTTWTVSVTARAEAGQWAAWPTLDALITAVASVLDVAEARPGQVSLPTGGEPLPAYVLTLTPETLPSL